MNNKSIALWVVGLVVIFGGTYFLSNQSSNKSSTSVDNSNSVSNSTSKSAPTPKDPTALPVPSPIVHNVSIVNFVFSPSNITVRKGETIVWTNKDATAHTVTGGVNGDINSPLLAQNQTYSFVFDKTGTFSYHCKIHPSMTGTITVTN